MKGIAICFIVMLILQLATPFWWWIMLVPFLFGMLGATSAWQGARTGMFSAGFLWLSAGLFYWLTASQIITARVAKMLGERFEVESVILVFAVTTMVAALAGGASAATGFWGRELFAVKANRA
ncbi:hypothetical protein EDS67_08825 [candidate division KSB1 bacterium]|nr:MAG: hypothetical protein EDS67_08825 [candidate division KSB1 bacterium]MBC6950180.1 hypothetical protein [candidate division KSB1 bacterium]MCE7942775.1 hypothetical protein [Chlorobi bacterium CHB1]MDL1878687.1 hypothetical protein [Cytophagia bacterium CHB2]